MRRRPPRSTRTDTLVPDTTLYRSGAGTPPPKIGSPPRNPASIRRRRFTCACVMDASRPRTWGPARRSRLIGEGAFRPHLPLTFRAAGWRYRRRTPAMDRGTRATVRMFEGVAGKNGRGMCRGGEIEDEEKTV